MNINKLNIWSILVLFFVLAISACEEVTTPEPDNNEDTTSVDTSAWSGYVVGFRATEGDASADYVLTTEDLMTGTITSTGQGYEQAGWSYYFSAGENYFSMGYTLNECIGYQVDDEGELEVNSKFLFERIDLLGAISDDEFLAIGAPWGGGSYDCQFQVVDANKVEFTKIVSDPIYESYVYVDSLGEDVRLNAWPTGAYLNGNTLYVSFYALHGVTWDTPNVGKAMISIYSYPELEYIKTIEDDRTSPIGYYGGSPALLTTESGDIYTLSSSSYFAGFTKVEQPSGILKINAGETEFDDSYFFNIEEEYGFKVLTGKYVGNGKAVARVTVAADDVSPDYMWAAFGNYDVCKLVVIDLENKSLTEVADVPVHAGQYQTPFLVEDGKVYMSIRQNANNEAYVYRIDPETTTAEKGAKIDGLELQGIFKHN